MPQMPARDGAVLGSVESFADNSGAGFTVDQQWTLDDAGVEVLAERLGIGPRHLSRLFKKHLGSRGFLSLDPLRSD